MTYLKCLWLCLWLISATISPVLGGDWTLAENEVGAGKPALIEKVITSGKRRVSLNLVSFKTRDFTLQVVDQGDTQSEPTYRSLQQAMEANNCVAGVNGGFFGKDFTPLGVVYQDGKRLAPYSSSSRGGLASGVIWSGAGGIHIAYRSQFKGGTGVKQAIQTGPMLITNGEKVAGLSTARPRPRSFVLTDWKGNWMIGTSSFLSLADLAAILDSDGIFPEFSNQRVDRAINLDGGRSTGFYHKSEGGEVTYRSELTTVRNFLGITSK